MPKLGYHLTLREIYEYPLKTLFKPKADHVYPADVMNFGSTSTNQRSNPKKLHFLVVLPAANRGVLEWAPIAATRWLECTHLCRKNVRDSAGSTIR